MKTEITKVKKRNEVKYDKVDGILKNGTDNLYPQRMERIINSSITAKSAAKMYANFLVGNGFVDESLNKIIVGQNLYKSVTLYDILEKIATSIAYQNGAALKLRYDANYKSTEIDFLPYKNCRFGKPDDLDYSGRIIYYNNWDKSLGKIDKSKFASFNIFNPDPEVIKYQILKSGQQTKLNEEFYFQKWKGQIAMLLMEDEYVYPLSPIDPAQDDADTEYQISLFKNGELSRNFFAKYIVKHAEFSDPNDKAIFIKTYESFMGAENNGASMIVQGDITQSDNGDIIDNTFKLEKIEQNINDKLFVEWESSIANNCRKVYNAIPKILIDTPEGIFGTTGGKAFIDAANFYNEMTKKDRQKISNFLQSIFQHFKNPINSDFEIKELKFGVEVSSQEEIDKERRKAQAVLRGSVGGVTSLLAIQQSVSSGTTDIESGIAIIQEIYGISEEIARKMLGTPKETNQTTV